MMNEGHTMNVYQVELAISLKGRWSILLMEVDASTENEAMDFAVAQAEEAELVVSVNGCTYLYPCETLN